jgi:undecaprenyl-diphosphatase
MDILQALLLGIVQGLTEFLPVSSTAHLRIVPFYMGWEDPGAAFSAVIQLGTLAAVFIYFSPDIKRLIIAALAGIQHRNLSHSPESRLAWSIIPGTIPIAVLGLSFKDYIENEARGLPIIATSLIVLALFLILAERIGRQSRSMRFLGFWQIQLIGLCQALALIPGCSRSGSTIMGGLFIGLKHQEAARFSFILGLPAIGGSGLLELKSLVEDGIGGAGLINIAIGVLAAAISGYLSIGLLMRVIQRYGTDYFSVYRIALGGIILLTLNWQGPGGASGTAYEPYGKEVMYPNPLKEKLQRGDVVFGSGLPAPSPHIAGAICSAGPDFIWIDTEHMPYGSEALDSIPVLVRQRGVAPMIRVAANDPALIKKAYDVGAVAVMVPQINTPEEAAQAVQYARYAPLGQRGLSPMWTFAAGEDWNHVIKTANEETVLVLQLESQQAYDNIDAIKEVPGFDVLLVGPLDLSATLGRITETGSKEVQQIMEDVPRRLEGSGKVAGTTLNDVAELQEKIRWGYRYLNVGSVMGYGTQVLKNNLEALRANPKGEA